MLAVQRCPYGRSALVSTVGGTDFVQCRTSVCPSIYYHYYYTNAVYTLFSANVGIFVFQILGTIGAAIALLGLRLRGSAKYWLLKVLTLIAASLKLSAAHFVLLKSSLSLGGVAMSSETTASLIAAAQLMAVGGFAQTALQTALLIESSSLLRSVYDRTVLRLSKKWTI
jgi:hypothetical protein